MLLKKLWKG
uniref:Uncharacterized protein n=1 Tax=Rhodnius prolixus TaxID=13249 RepID=A0A0G2KBG4_RHOPR